MFGYIKMKMAEEDTALVLFANKKLPCAEFIAYRVDCAELFVKDLQEEIGVELSHEDIKEIEDERPYKKAVEIVKRYGERL